MKAVLQKGLILLCLALPGAALCTEPALQIPPGLISAKISVGDFKASIDFYVKYFGMKQGPRLNSFEQRLQWPSPGYGSNLTLVHDDSGQIKFPKTTSFLVFRVDDARALAKQMHDDGVQDVDEVHDAIVMDTGLRFFLAKDPDGNTVEGVQVLGPIRK